MSSSFPNEALFFIADREYTIDELIQTLYHSPVPETRSHFKAINSHLKNGRALPGQMVIITPPKANSCQVAESVMQQTAMEVDKELANMSPREREVLAEHYAFLSNITTATAPMYGWANNYFSQKGKMVEHTLKRIEQLYITTYRNHGHLNSSHFFNQRKILFTQLDQNINGMMERQLFGQDVPANRIKAQLGLKSKSIVHQWKMQGNTGSLKGYASNYEQLAKTSRTFARLGYLSMALDVGGGVANIQKACTLKPGSEECSRAKVVEPAKVAGSIGGGMAGGYLAGFIACNLVFGLPSGGSSLLWCSVVAGAVGGYGGSKVGGWVAGDKIAAPIFETVIK
ncbi:hypothetical protein [Endozoicomonas arenosclerae]|uniref:hypothetical protein n=1 Tax=Endozoicomonas arenosclerae TaxID=1633495 RepID=UPI000785811B|nr:hypothetical protein [Endozoicomonas arenosclerae]